MNEEIAALEKNNTWKLAEPSTEKEVIELKWIYKAKYKPDGSIQKLKARLVTKCYLQQAGIDFNRTFAPVARFDTIRTVLALSAQNKWKVFQFDVKSAFLNGFLDEEVFFEQPQGYKIFFLIKQGKTLFEVVDKET